MFRKFVLCSGLSLFLFCALGGSDVSANAVVEESKVSSGSNQKTIESRLSNAAYERLRQLKATATSDAQNEIKRIVEAGSRKLVRDRGGDKKIREAERAIARIMGEAVRNSGQQRNGTVTVNSNAIVSALGRLCPLYPFC